MNVTPKSKLLEMAAEIQSYLEVETTEELPELEDRGFHLAGYMAMTGKMLADAKHHQDQKVKNSILHRMNLGLSPTVLNKLTSAEAEEENYLVTWIDRLNRSCVHQMDFVRTMISKAKEEMRMQGFGQT